MIADIDCMAASCILRTMHYLMLSASESMQRQRASPAVKSMTITAVRLRTVTRKFGGGPKIVGHTHIYCSLGTPLSDSVGILSGFRRSLILLLAIVSQIQMKALEKGSAIDRSSVKVQGVFL
jgi:hypothetical protein